MRLFQAALDTPLNSPFSATLSVHGLHFTVCAPSSFAGAPSDYLTNLGETKQRLFPLSAKRLKRDQEIATFWPKATHKCLLRPKKSLFLSVLSLFTKRTQSLFLVSFESDKWSLLSVPVAALGFTNLTSWQQSLEGACVSLGLNNQGPSFPRSERVDWVQCN